MNSTIRLIKEVVCRQLFKKQLHLGQGKVLTQEELLSPGLCLFCTLILQKNTKLFMTCTITQFNGYPADIRVLYPERLLTPALKEYIRSRMTRKVMAFQLYPHLGITEGEWVIL